jgi:hypothetical protein
MSGSDAALVIYAVGQLITAGVAAYGVLVSVRNNRKLDAVHTLTNQVKEETNGMKDELIRSVTAGAFAKGVKSETDKLESSSTPRTPSRG